MLLDPSTGATVLAGPDLVRMLGGEPGVQQELMRFQVETATQGVHQPGRPRPRADPAPPARRGRRGTAGLPPGGVRGRAVPRARAGRRDRPAPVPGAGPPVRSAWWPRPGAPAAATCTSGSRPATSASRCWRGCGPGLRRCSPSPSTPRSPAAATPAGPAGGTLTWSRWPTAIPPAAWPDAAAYDAAVRRLITQGAAVDERSIHFLARLSPRYPTVEVRVADVCLDAGTAVLLAGLTRALVATALAEARQGTPVAARAGPAGRRGAGRRGPAGARRGRSRPVHRAARRCAQPPLPPAGSCLSRAQRPRRHRDHHRAAAPARRPGDRGRPPAGPVRQRRIPAPVRQRTRPRHPIR